MSLSTTSSLNDHIAERMGEARARTLELLRPLPREDLRIQHDPLMSPILWDLGHIAHFEELWLTRNVDGEIKFVEMPGLFNPMEHPRSQRASLNLPEFEEIIRRMADIRHRVLARLARADLGSAHPLLRNGYVYHMVLQHEYQHNETILQTLQLKQGEPYHPMERRVLPVPGLEPIGMARFDGGEISIGTEDRRAAYDNERPRHHERIAPFRIDRAPVTNGEYLEFMVAGGYDSSKVWSPEGWRWRTESGVNAPKYWFQRDGAWHTRVMDATGPIEGNKPVCHVCYYEAEAYARFAGKRLPTETEWEVAATWDPATGRAAAFPWGEAPPTPDLANVDQSAFDTAVIGSFARNVSPLGCYGMIGDVWEWTSSDFSGYPGFQPYPYPEYSEVFFGSEYKVLRGGSWATRAGAIRSTFRNWDYPIRRQIFSGFRCAADV
ncbi:MAG TPA: ergothioneine biosynthesis protein EgtB [Gemmatimonadales bacterium]|nr:ergothioneine biosynthesis protein EgtB [Gemmatimonadales bacterium]